MHLEIVGKNPRSGGSECVLFGHVGRGNNRFEPIGRASEGEKPELSTFGGWEIKEMRPGEGLGFARALVASSAGGEYSRSTGRVVLLTHRWSGVLQVNDIGRRYKIDLYSEATRLVLLDIVNEIILDVTGLASTADGALALPDMTIDGLVDHVVANAVWFRFLEMDAEFEPGLLRRAIELLRKAPPATLRRRLVHAILPAVNARPAPVAATPPPPAFVFNDLGRLQDETRLLAAAVEGLALRATKA